MLWMSEPVLTDAVVVELDVGAPDALRVELLVGVGIEL